MYKYGRKYIIGLFVSIITIINVSSTFAVRDIMDVMFQPAKGYEKVIDLGSTKNAVGNEVFKESTQLGINENFGKGCFVNGQHIDKKEIQKQIDESGYKGGDKSFCEDVLGGDMDVSVFGSQTQAPLIVRITKFLLRMTIVLAITMVLYNGILRIIESAKGGDVKDAKDNILYIVGGILLALSSVAIINLISSITLSSLNPNNMPQSNDGVVTTNNSSNTTRPTGGGDTSSSSYDTTENNNGRGGQAEASVQ